MPTETISMRQAREIIRMKFTTDMSRREIARRLGLSKTTIRKALIRAESAGLSWPLPEGMTDTQLSEKLYEYRHSQKGQRLHDEPDWSAIHKELKANKHVTLTILWDEYNAHHPNGYKYSRFCELYRSFAAKLSPTMRQTHRAGERLFVDYAGDGVPVVDRVTGEIRMAQVFVAVLEASSHTFSHATWTQTLIDWVDSHVRAFETIDGVTELLVPDNTKTAFVKASLYEPQVDKTYTEIADHYGTTILPARPRKPRDKAKVEQAVLVVERWLLGRLRHQVFHSLAEVNAAIA